MKVLTMWEYSGITPEILNQFIKDNGIDERDIVNIKIEPRYGGGEDLTIYVRE